MLSVYYYDRDGHYRRTDARDLAHAVEVCAWLRSCTVGATPLSIEDHEGRLSWRKWTPDGKEMQ